jgi:hypothetical protein
MSDEIGKEFEAIFERFEKLGKRISELEKKPCMKIEKIFTTDQMNKVSAFFNFERKNHERIEELDEDSKEMMSAVTKNESDIAELKRLHQTMLEREYTHYTELKETITTVMDDVMEVDGTHFINYRNIESVLTELFSKIREKVTYDPNLGWLEELLIYALEKLSGEKEVSSKKNDGVRGFGVATQKPSVASTSTLTDSKPEEPNSLDRYNQGYEDGRKYQKKKDSTEFLEDLEILSKQSGDYDLQASYRFFKRKWEARKNER